MISRFLNMLRNGKEWFELHDFPIGARAAIQKFADRYSITDASVPGLWEMDRGTLQTIEDHLATLPALQRSTERRR